MSRLGSSRGTQLRDVEGFDDSYYDSGARTWRVRCSQCASMVINGVASHEHGCLQATRREGAR